MKVNRVPKKIVARFSDGRVSETVLVMDMFEDMGEKLVMTGIQHRVRVYEGTHDTFCAVTSARGPDGLVMDAAELAGDGLVSFLLAAVATARSLGLDRTADAVEATMGVLDEEAVQQVADNAAGMLARMVGVDPDLLGN